MSSTIVPSGPQAGSPYPLASGDPVAGYVTAPGPGASSEVTQQLTRSWVALKRYKWLMLVIVAVGTSVGVALSKLVTPKYTVNATIWVAKAGGGNGPITSPGLITDALSWSDLAKSYIVLDAVVSKLALYVVPQNAADTLVVRSLQPSDSLARYAGKYSLTLEEGGTRYSLTRRGEQRGQQDVVVERGVVGDSIGRRVGFLWQPDPRTLQGKRTVSFDVVTPREAAVTLGKNFVITGPTMNGNLMRLALTGGNSGLLASTMNSLVHEFVGQAARLRTENLTAASAIVEEQLQRAAETMREKEVALESFKVNTITEPNENTIVTAGTALAQNPVLAQFFNDNVTYQQHAKDAEALDRILKEADQNGGRIPMEALRSLPLVLQQNSELATEKTTLETMHAQLRALQLQYTDSFLPVRELRRRIDELESKTIPSLTRESLRGLRIQEAEMKRRVAAQATELRKIPPRTVEEQRRQREVDVSTRIYTDLAQRAVSARLAKMSALPDVSILDSAVAPRLPSSDTKTSLFLVAIAASVAMAIGLALVLDRLDKRFRYPEQATGELGLDIMGAIPTLTNPRNSSTRLQEATQLVESFRSLSLSVRSAFDGAGTIQFTVSSPGPGDGKSFISANLASALADGGYRTVLIDGDIRRGALHSVFAPMEQSPGLLDYLSGESALSEVVRATSHGNLFLVPCGKRRRHGPELLAGQGMTGLVRDLGAQFDAIVVDSAPLGAGIDPFALGVATGAMLLVLRTGETDRRLAQSKLQVLDRLPVRVLGTVLNDIGHNPQFRYYYYYLEGYSSLEAGTGRTDRLPAESGA